MIDRFRDLRAFLVLAEERHFGRAAIRLGLAQPNLSAIIHRLETRIGTRLLRRRPFVELTAAGEIVAQGARNTLDQLEVTVQRAGLAGAGEIGLVRVGFASTAMLSTFPDLLRLFWEAHPDIDLKLQEMTSTEQWDALRLGYIDVAITREPSEDDAARKILVVSEPFCVALPAGHRLAVAEGEILLQMLTEENFVMFRRSRGAPLHDTILSLCAAERFAPRVLHEVDELHSVFGLVRAGFGVALVPEGFGRVSWPGVVCRPLVQSQIRAQLFCCFRPATISAAVRGFLASIVEGVGSADIHHSLFADTGIDR